MKKAALAFVLACAVAIGTMPQTACTPAQVTTVVTDITKFSPVVVNVLELACAFSPGAALCATGAAVLNKSIADLVAALNTYNAQVAAGTATSSTWNILNAVFATFEAQTADIFNLFRISNAGTQTQALAVVTAAQVLLSVIEALFPSAPVAVANVMSAEAPRARLAIYAGSLPAGGVAGFSYSTLEKDYNHKVDAAKKSNPHVNLNRVHVHGLFVRVVTVGRAN